jgi:hypothetical protein
MASRGNSPAQIFALVFGAVLLAAGILGFFYNASFAVGGQVESDAVLGILAVNAWHNIVHILSGVLGLAVAGSYSAARLYAFGLGAVYVLVTILGFAYGDGNAIFEVIPINTEDNILHLLIAIAGIGAGLATPSQPAPTTAAA